MYISLFAILVLALTVAQSGTGGSGWGVPGCR